MKTQVQLQIEKKELREIKAETKVDIGSQAVLAAARVGLQALKERSSK